MAKGFAFINGNLLYEVCIKIAVAKAMGHQEQGTVWPPFLDYEDNLILLDVD